MFKGFQDENTDKMRSLAKAIPAPVAKFQSSGHSFAKAASGGIAGNFFDNTPTEPRALDIDQLVAELAGAENAARFKFGFSDMLRSQFPTIPEMWGLAAPKPALSGGMVDTGALNLAAPADRTTVGGASWPVAPEGASQAGKALAAALQANLTAKIIAKAASKSSGGDDAALAEYRAEIEKHMPPEVLAEYRKSRAA